MVFRRVLPGTPSFEALGLPPVVRRLAEEPRGMILVTGPTGSGKTTTIAAMIDHINENKAVNIVTIEDPIEVLHPDKRSIVNQREIGTDTEDYAQAMKRVLRQDPDVIFIGEMRDPETVWAALAAAETGHLVLSTLHTTDASKTVERIIGVFPLTEQHTIRNRFAKSFRYIVSQRLLPRKGGTGRVAAIEILKSTLRTREYLDKGEVEGKSLLDAMRDGDTEGMQHFDGEIEKLIRADLIDYDTAMAYATNPGNLRLQLTDLGLELPPAQTQPTQVKKATPPPVQAKKKEETELEIE
jgi:twitching motility protein PilT